MADWPKELDDVEVKPFPQCHRVADGSFWAHEGDGKWEMFDGDIFTVQGSPEDLDRFRRLCEGKDTH
jgi:hypothetical protein